MDLKLLEAKLRQYFEKHSFSKEVTFAISVQPNKDGYWLIIDKSHNHLTNSSRKYISRAEVKSLNDQSLETLIKGLIDELEERPDPGPGISK